MQVPASQFPWLEASFKHPESCSRKVHRNLDPALHPHEKAVEYTRALNAAKLQRVFAKPFVGALPHDDGVTALARNPAQLNSLVSGAADGTVRLWDVAAQRCLRRLEGGQLGAIPDVQLAPCTVCYTSHFLPVRAGAHAACSASPAHYPSGLVHGWDAREHHARWLARRINLKVQSQLCRPCAGGEGLCDRSGNKAAVSCPILIRPDAQVQQRLRVDLRRAYGSRSRASQLRRAARRRSAVPRTRQRGCGSCCTEEPDFL